MIYSLNDFSYIEVIKNILSCPKWVYKDEKVACIN
jgi:hypothetical protein